MPFQAEMLNSKNNQKTLFQVVTNCFIQYHDVDWYWMSALSIQTAGLILTNDPLAERGGHGLCT